MPFDIIIGRDESDKKKFQERGLIQLGKGYVTMGNYTSLSNLIWMDIARSHVILVSGKRGSGKSYSIGTIAESLADLEPEIKSNIASLIFDTMGIFWTMKFKNEKEKALLDEWSLKPKNIPVKIFAPSGFFQEYESRGIPVDEKFLIKPSELEVEDWITTFNLSMIDPISIAIERVISNLKETGDYGIKDIIEKLKEHKNEIAVSLFEGAETWGVFASRNEQGTPLTSLIEGGRMSILDLSCYSSIGAYNIRALVIGLICKKLFQQRMLARKREEIQAVQHGIDYLAFKQEREMPLVWLFLDEVHEFLAKEGKTPATDALIQILREGRQPGISLVLATQQPGQIHNDVMTQSDIVISHRLTAQPDIQALNQIMQSYLFQDIKVQLDNLPNLKGSALILDDNSERIYPMKIKPRFTWHGGEAPTAIKVEKRI
jgi:hypothetical protein